MAIDHILSQIDLEIASLTQARKILANIGSITTAGSRKAAKGTLKSGKKRVLSADARKRIADAQRKRWAAVHAKAKKKA